MLLPDFMRAHAFHKKDGHYQNSLVGSNENRGYRICPLIYDPSYDDGQRFRYTKYYPHPEDRQFLVHGMADDLMIELYPNLFYDNDGNRKYSTTYGEPYAPAVKKIFPYDYPLDGIQWGDQGMWKLHGILQIV